MDTQKTYRIGADPFPPYQYYKDDKILAGSDYETVKLIFDRLGLRTEYILDVWSKIENMLERQQLDAVFQVQKTPARESRYYFSNLLRNAVTEVITGNSKLILNEYNDIAQKGLKLGVIRGYSNGRDIDALPNEIKHTYADTASLLQAVLHEEVDVAVVDKGVKEYTMEQLGTETLVTQHPLTFIRPLYVVFRDAELRDAFDGMIHKGRVN